MQPMQISYIDVYTKVPCTYGMPTDNVYNTRYTFYMIRYRRGNQCKELGVAPSNKHGSSDVFSAEDIVR